MNDRDLMENMLLLEKGVCDLYMHGTIESSSADVHKAFSNSLNTALDIQEKIYSKMEDRGWYKPEQAEQSKMDCVRMKFGN